MAREERWDVKRILRAAALTVVLSLAGGYVIFYGLFPIAAFPASSDASLILMLVILAATAVLVGLASDDLVNMVFECFIALFLSGVVVTVLALSPAVAGVQFISPDSIAGFIIHYGFLLFALAFVTDMVGGTIGLILRERYFYRGASTSPGPWERK